MDLHEAISARHAVRAYTDEPIEPSVVERLQETIDRCRVRGGVELQLVTDEPHAFGNALLHYGRFRNVRNYVAIASHANAGWEERCGYYGAQVLLRAVQLGLDTCWVALTFSKRRVGERLELRHREQVRFAIALGHGVTHGRPHRSKSFSQVASAAGPGAVPQWFEHGVQSALLAPTALNQQRFMFTLEADRRTVRAESGIGPCVRTDLGIAKYFFEVGARPHEPVRWS